ncbi:MAG TPA: CvpA family protein [Bryobacteraceae bacterium]|nr:CvpA family protein [Bryobacteraceae bacterium]
MAEEAAMNNWIDLTLGLLLIVSIISGVKAGFARAAVSFAAAVLGLVFGLRYYHVVAESMHLHLSHEWVANLIGFNIVFIGITMLGSVVAEMFGKFIRSLDLVWLDRALGGGFGLVRGLLFGTVMIWGIMALLPVQPKLVLAHSRLAPCVMESARWMAESSPDEVKRTFRQSYRELNRVLPEKVKEKMPPLNAGQI